jgi:deoxycytidylate deaminase
MDLRRRLTWDEYGCLLALIGKSRSEDPFTKVGGVALNKDGRVLGVSYNGLKSKVEIPDWMYSVENRERKSDFFIHSEANLCALLKKGECHTLCLTQSPCIKCCQNIAALDIKRIVYVKEYNNCNKFRDFLNFYTIEYQELTNDSKRNILNYLKNLNNFCELNI